MICTKCSIDKPESEYHFRCLSKALRHTACKACTKIAQTDYARKNRKKVTARSMLWTANNPTLSREFYGGLKYAECSCCSLDTLKAFYKACPVGLQCVHLIIHREGGEQCIKNLRYMTPSERYYHVHKLKVTS